MTDLMDTSFSESKNRISPPGGRGVVDAAPPLSHSHAHDRQRALRCYRHTAREVKTDKPVTIERLERALAFCAYLVELDGEKAIPIFEKIEGELSAKRAQQGVAERARQLLHSLRNGAGSGALSAPNTIEHT